jgi:hypothetical protein
MGLFYLGNKACALLPQDKTQNSILDLYDTGLPGG